MRNWFQTGCVSGITVRYSRNGCCSLPVSYTHLAYIPAIEQCIEEGHTDIVTGDQQYFQSFYDTAMNVKADPMTKYDRPAWTSMTAQMDLSLIHIFPGQSAVL